jgi:hypothetical protein
VKGVNAESDEMRSGQEQKSTAELPFQMVEREVELETSVGETSDLSNTGRSLSASFASMIILTLCKVSDLTVP